MTLLRKWKNNPLTRKIYLQNIYLTKNFHVEQEIIKTRPQLKSDLPSVSVNKILLRQSGLSISVLYVAVLKIQG